MLYLIFTRLAVDIIHKVLKFSLTLINKQSFEKNSAFANKSLFSNQFKTKGDKK